MTYTDRERLERLKLTFKRNYRVSNLYALLLERFPEIITKDMIDALTKEGDFGIEDAVCALLTEIFALDYENEEDRYVIKNYIRPSIKILDAEKYRHNPYYKHIKIENVKDGDWEFRLESYKPYRFAVCGDMVINPDFSEFAPLGFFTEEFKFPAVLEGGNEWMTLTPVDLDTCELAIEKARGGVITFGLGLGYYAYMASRKEEVRSVTIIEKNAKIIELFKKHVLVQFENPDKVRIINDDAFHYAEFEMPKENYDYAFVDTWRDASDGAPMYKKMKALEKLSSGTEFDYWVEGFLVSRLRALKFEKCLENIEKYEKYEDFVKEILWENVTNG